MSRMSEEKKEEVDEVINEAVTAFAKRIFAIEDYFEEKFGGLKVVYESTDGRKIKIIALRSELYEGNKND